MGSIVNKAVEIGSFGAIKDVTGEEAAAAAATKAGRIQADAAQAGVAETRRQFDITQGTLAPTIEAGDLARQQQQALLGLSGHREQQAALTTLQESPAQRFLRARAQKNLLQNQAAIGGLGGGNVRSALVEQGAGFAAQDIGNQFSRLQSLSAPGTQTAVSQGQLGSQAAGQVAQQLGQAGAATASGLLGAQQARSQTTQQLIGGAATGAALLSDRTKKRDIKDLDLKECYDSVMSMDLKAWKYLEGLGYEDKEHFGVMAQDAPEMIKMDKEMALDLHDEINLIAGALQYARQEGLTCL